MTWYHIFLGLALIIAIVPLLAASSYAHPSADDYDYSLLTHEAALHGNILDVLRAAAETHASFTSSWLALYSPAALQSLQPAIFGYEFYWITCPIMLVFIFCGFSFLSRALMRYVLKCDGLLWLPLAGAMLLFFLLEMPAANEALFWWNGGANYLPFWALGTASLGLMLKYYVNIGNDAWTIGGSAILAFIVAGSPQINSFALILMLAYLCLVEISKSQRFLGLIPLAMAILGFILMATHPGTAARSAAIGVDASILQTFMLSLRYVRESLLQWVNLEWLLFFCALIPLFIAITNQSQRAKSFFTVRTVLLFLILSLLFLFALYCVPAYSLGSNGPGRLRNIVFANFVILSVIEAFLVFGLIWTRMTNSSRKATIDSMRQNPTFTVAALMALLLLPNNAIVAMQGLHNGSFESYDQSLQERYAIIEQSDRGDVLVPPLHSYPELLFFSDIEEAPTNWKNRSYAKYYSLGSIAIQPENESEN